MRTTVIERANVAKGPFSINSGVDPPAEASFAGFGHVDKELAAIPHIAWDHHVARRCRAAAARGTGVDARPNEHGIRARIRRVGVGTTAEFGNRQFTCFCLFACSPGEVGCMFPVPARARAKLRAPQ
jgi:hypothetical protein